MKRYLFTVTIGARYLVFSNPILLQQLSMKSTKPTSMGLIVAFGIAKQLRSMYPAIRAEAHQSNGRITRKMPIQHSAMVLVSVDNTKAEFMIQTASERQFSSEKNRGTMIDVYVKLIGSGGYSALWPQPGAIRQNGPMCSVDIQSPDSMEQLLTAINKVVRSHFAAAQLCPEAAEP